MKHAHYDNDSGAILGFYADDVHETIPSPSLELTDEQWEDALNYPKLVKNGALVDAPEMPPAPEPTAADKLAAAGLTVEDLKQLLGLK
jgi:hypothetical protein